MILLEPRSTRTATLFPYTTLFRSIGIDALFLDGPTTNIPALIGVGTVVRDRNAKLMYGDACRLAKHAEIATVGLRPIIAGAVIVGARDVIALSRERRGRPGLIV